MVVLRLLSFPVVLLKILSVTGSDHDPTTDTTSLRGLIHHLMYVSETRDLQGGPLGKVERAPVVLVLCFIALGLHILPDLNYEFHRLRELPCPER